MTGVLIALSGPATNLVPYLHRLGKEYVGVGELHSDVAKSRLQEVMGIFIGEIFQRPPVRASVSRKLRTRNIFYFDLLEYENRRFLFRVGTEAGTYIRKLIHDLGLLTGSGAHMVQLRRTRDGPFGESQSHEMWSIALALEIYRSRHDETELRKVILPIESAVSVYPSIYIKDGAVSAVCHGANLSIGGVSSFEEPVERGNVVCVKTLKGELVAMARSEKDSHGLLNDRTGLAATTERVLMDRALYPKMWRQ